MCAISAPAPQGKTIAHKVRSHKKSTSGRIGRNVLSASTVFQARVAYTSTAAACSRVLAKRTIGQRSCASCRLTRVGAM